MPEKCRLCLSGCPLSQVEDDELRWVIDKIFYFKVFRSSEDATLICDTCRETVSGFHEYAESVWRNQQFLRTCVVPSTSGVGNKAIVTKVEDAASLGAVSKKEKIEEDEDEEQRMPVEYLETSMGTGDDSIEDDVKEDRDWIVPDDDDEDHLDGVDSDNDSDMLKPLVAKTETVSFEIEELSNDVEYLEEVRSSKKQKPKPKKPVSSKAPVVESPKSEIEQQLLQHYDLSCDLCAQPLAGFGELLRHFKNIHNRFLQPVHKWPFEYAGEPNIIKLGEFLNQVNTYAVTEEMDEQTLLRSIKHLLKGRALQWYTRCYFQLISWDVFKTEIKQEFLPPNYSEIIKQDLYLRFQGPNESFTSFYRDLLAAFEIVEPTITESEKLFIVKSHLNSDYTPIAAASRATTIKELVAVCKDFEVSRSYSVRGRASTANRSTWHRSDTATYQRPVMNRTEVPNRTQFNRPTFNEARINSLELNTEIEEAWDPILIREREAVQHDIALQHERIAEGTDEVHAVRLQNNWRERTTSNPQPPTTGEQQTRHFTPTIICWQCDKSGHTYLHCPNPKRFLFCYSCGKKGCTTRNCDACISRWRQLDSINIQQHSENRNWENPQ
ncbi:uncharacterized protein LOC134216060 [Armigeres subalbatus]|uniref:uncharacterized protein LOC134216060 n=1 Tax=Armigeres subalbatus TaxID=124917 RepID=UPI002ED4FD01